MKIVDTFLRALRNILPSFVAEYLPNPDKRQPGESTYTSVVPPSSYQTDASQLMTQAKRYSVPPPEGGLNFLYGLTTETLRGNERSERDILYIATSRDSLSGAAFQIYSNLDILGRLNRTDDPYEFGLIVRDYWWRVTDTLGSFLEQGPAGFNETSRYADDVILGPNRYIFNLFDAKFQEQIDNENRDIELIRHDSVGRISYAAAFNEDNLMEEDWTATMAQKLGAMRSRMKASSNVEERTLKAIFPSALLGTVSGVNFEVRIDSRLNYREGLDLNEVDYILEELVHNALKYHHGSEKEGRYIRVRWNRAREAIVVEDNGSGIENVDLIWEMGVREAERHPGVKGTGVGLASVKERLERLGWTIEVKSKVGEGTRILIHPKEGDIIKGTPPTSGSLLPEWGNDEITAEGSGGIGSADAYEIEDAYMIADDEEEFVSDESDYDEFDFDPMIAGAFTAAGVADIAVFAGI